MEYTQEFETFWRNYPKRWNRSSHRYYKVGKWEAFQAWKRLSQKDRNDILIKVKYMKDGEFVLDAYRWLKKRRFDDMEIRKPRRKEVVKPIERIISPEEEAERTEKGRKWKVKYDKYVKRLFEMTIGLLQLNLFIPQANSLKSKRRILKSLKDKIRHKFNVSVAEIDSLDKWQKQTLAIACVNSDKRLANSILSKIVNLIDAQHGVELVDYGIEFY